MDQLHAAGTDVVGVSRRGSATDSGIAAWDMASEPPPTGLLRSWDTIVNAAANTRWTMSPEEAMDANVASVQALQPLVGKGTHVVHISTAYAVGLRGDVESSELSAYRNTYEWSKAQAERVARQIYGRLTIVRPPLIVGRRCDGRAARFAGMYTLVRGLTVGTVPAVVADPQARFDAIPVDDLCELLIELIGDGDRSGPPVTIAAGMSAPSVDEAITTVVDSLNRWRRGRGLEPVAGLPVISPDSWERFFQPFVTPHLTHRQLIVLELLGSFKPYLALPEPLKPERLVEDILPCLESSTTYWADTNPRLAARTPRPWRGGAEPEMVTADA
jgi:nucleoside-diphosphate-sugar epimerase